MRQLAAVVAVACLAPLGLVGSAVPFGIGAQPAGAASVTPTWVRAAVGGPLARRGAAVADDPATGRLVLFGGADGSGFLGDTWTWDGSVWAEQSPAVSPPAGEGASMAYDAATGQVVLFGGLGGDGDLGETWTWDGSGWTQQSPAVSPPARHAAAMAYDAATGQLVLFGGSSVDHGFLADTWTWDGSGWTQQSQAAGPSARQGAAMAYDSTTGQLVLFGGLGSGVFGDTWSWDGTGWTQLSPDASPSAREFAAFGDDPATGQAVLFGGDDGSGVLGDTWSWDGSGWTQQAAPADGPSARELAAIAYDSSTSQLVLFGGTGGSGFLDDTWTWFFVPDDDLALTGVPADITTPATGPDGADVAYTPPTAVDGDSPATAATCSPASGSMFPIGVTKIVCSAHDSDDTPATATASFTVTVQGATAQTAQLSSSAAGVASGGSLSGKLQTVAADLASGDTKGAKGALTGFINEVKAQSGKKINRALANMLIAQAQQIQAVIGP